MSFHLKYLTGVIHFGVEANETKENAVTTEVVHSETPVYSDEVLAISSNSNTLSSRSNYSEHGSSYSNRIRMTSDSTISRRSSNGSESRRKAGHANAGLMGYAIKTLDEISVCRGCEKVILQIQFCEFPFIS